MTKFFSRCHLPDGTVLPGGSCGCDIDESCTRCRRRNPDMPDDQCGEMHTRDTEWCMRPRWHDGCIPEERLTVNDWSDELLAAVDAARLSGDSDPVRRLLAGVG